MKVPIHANLQYLKSEVVGRVDSDAPVIFSNLLIVDIEINLFSYFRKNEDISFTSTIWSCRCGDDRMRVKFKHKVEKARGACLHPKNVID